MDKVKQLFNQVSPEEIGAFIDSLPKHIRDMLPESEVALLDCLELLPDTISKGRILKVTIDNYLDCEDVQGKNTEDDRTGTSMGLLYALDDNSEIKIHKHNDDMETYISIEKVLKMPKEIDEIERDLPANICRIDSELEMGSKHGIGPMPKGTLIGTFKVHRDKISEYFTPKKHTPQTDVER